MMSSTCHLSEILHSAAPREIIKPYVLRMQNAFLFFTFGFSKYNWMSGFVQCLKLYHFRWDDFLFYFYRKFLRLREMR
jgi:hypothetical protein